MKRTIVVLLLVAFVMLPAMGQDSKPAANTDEKNAKLISQYQQEVQDLHSIIEQYDAQIKQLKEQVSKLNETVATLNKSQSNTTAVPAASTSPETPQPAATPAQSYWVNLLEKVDVKRDTAAGQWNLSASGLSGNAPQSGTGMIILPVTPTGSYDMTFEFSRSNGINEIQLDLPVGSRSIRIVLSRPNGWTEDNQYQRFAAGMEYVDGMGVLQNQMFAGNNFILTNGQNHYLNIRIREDGTKASVNVFYDDAELVDWSGSLTSLSMFPDADSKQARKFGVSISAGTTMLILEARVRMFQPAVQPTPPAAPAAPAAPAPAAAPAAAAPANQ